MNTEATLKLDRVVLATDFSRHSERAFEYASVIAEQFDSELHLLHVIHTPETSVPEFGMGLAFPAYLENLPKQIEEAEKRAIAKLAELTPQKWAGHRPVVLATRNGPPFLEIIRYAREHKADLLVMGTHGRSALPHVLLGSVAEKVVRKASCAVLTVRLDDQDFTMP